MAPLRGPNANVAALRKSAGEPVSPPAGTVLALEAPAESAASPAAGNAESEAPRIEFAATSSPPPREPSLSATVAPHQEGGRQRVSFSAEFMARRSQSSLLSEGEIQRRGKKMETIVRTNNLAEDVKTMAAGDTELQRVLRAAARHGDAKDHKVVPIAAMIDELYAEQDRRRACRQIPFIILYFFLFGLTLMAHEKTADLSQVEREFRGMVEGTGFEGYGGPMTPNSLVVSGHKTMDDIDTVSDIYIYLQDAILPVYLPAATTGANAVRQQDQTRVLSYNNLIGGVQLIQLRRDRKPCSQVYPDLHPKAKNGKNPFTEDFDCFPQDSTSRDCFGPGSAVVGFCPSRGTGGGRRLNAAAHASRKRMSQAAQGAVNVDREGLTFKVNMMSHEGLDSAMQTLSQLESNNWLDDATLQVVIRLFVYNPDLDVYVKTDVNVFFAPSGELVPFVTVSSFLGDPYGAGAAGLMTMEICWVVLWLQIIGNTVLTAVKGKGGPKAFVKNPWSYLEILTILGGLAVVIVWFYYVDRLQVIKKKIMHTVDVNPNMESTAADVAVFQGHRDNMLTNLSDFLDDLDTFRWIWSCYTLFIMLRFFKAFEAQPRLAIVTHTVVGCSSDFIHFFIVFTSIFFSFTVSGMFLFGHRLMEWADPFLACTECLRILFGDFDWDELGEEYPLTAFLWFVGFMVLVFNIMFNMVLAIIMDTYGAVKTHTSTAPPFWESLSNLLLKERRHLGLPEVIAVLEKVEDREFIGVNYLKELVPEMSQEQADTIVTDTDKVVSNEDDTGLSLSDATRLVVKVYDNVHRVSQQIEQIRAIQGTTAHIAKRLPALVKANEPPKPKIWPSHITLEKLEPQVIDQVLAVEARMKSLETFLNQAMQYIQFRGNEAKARFLAVEDFIRASIAAEAGQ
eukprot:TRINITY_DN2858_c0_g2_i1.p1 TRINITY_DN2858_c0_g2~~TRINITY_DN2858_c0_g2_i1.p1  ORF type:complete len:904 (-),score=199.62 TRINITY_DN2858_c0_g2_i1:219-2930(-)